MKRLIGSVATVVVVAGTIVLGALPVSASCHIVNFSETNYTVQEDAGTVTIEIERQIFGNGCPGTINYSTEDDTAKDPSDYKKTSGTIAYASSEASKSYTVPIVNDSDQEGDETFKVTFTGTSPGPVTGSATVTIQDDDGGAGSPSPEVTTQVEDEAMEEEEDEGTPVGLIAAIAAGVLVLIVVIVFLMRRKPAA